MSVETYIHDNSALIIMSENIHFIFLTQARIDGAKFFIDSVEMGELQSGEMSLNGDKKEFEVGGFGKEIMIRGPKKYLSLAEVQVEYFCILDIIWFLSFASPSVSKC